MPGTKTIAEDVWLFLIIVVAADAAIAGIVSRSVPLFLWDTVRLILFIHVAGSIYCGNFSRARMWTWSIMVISLSMLFAYGVLSFILPWGQVQLWLATKLMNLFPALIDLPPIMGALFGAAVHLFAIGVCMGAMLTDIILAHHRWRRHSTRSLVVFLAAAISCAIAIQIAVWSFLPTAQTLSAQSPSGHLTPQHIVPPWWMLPFYSMFRAVPDKLAGLVLGLAALPALLTAPWLRGDIWRGSRLWPFWVLACFFLYTVWIGLTYLGSLPADGEGVIAWSRALIAYYFTFFLLMPFAGYGVSRSANVKT